VVVQDNPLPDGDAKIGWKRQIVEIGSDGARSLLPAGPYNFFLCSKSLKYFKLALIPERDIARGG